MRPALAHLRDQALVTTWAVAGVVAAALAASVHAPSEQARLVLDGAPVDMSLHGAPAFAEEPDDYLRWADAAYATRRAASPDDADLAAEHAALRAELARRGLPALP